MRFPSIFLPFLALLFGLLMACGESSNPVAELQKQVMAVHDEVMPKMGELAQLEKQLRDEYQSISQEAQPDSARMEVLLDHVSSLKNANEGMMVWMREYNPELKDLSETNAVIYLKEEMEKVEQVKADMINSLEAAQAIANE
ncbi:MAG: hypothetical protein AAF399_20240 [Bacteroidota bacterium]